MRTIDGRAPPTSRLPSGGPSTARTASVPAPPQTAWRRMYVAGATAALAGVALATGALFGWRYASSGTAPGPTVRFEVLPPAGVALRPSPVASAAQLALSPDGRHLAFIAATRGGPSQIWIRPLDSVQAQPLAGTEGASFPFWSPDGRFIAFFAAGKLRRVDTRGGTPQTLADAPTGRGGTWSGDGVILFSGQPSSPISRIPASGGTVRPVTTFDAAQATLTQYWPQFLPDGRHFLYYQRSAKAEHQGTYVTALDSSQSTRVLEIAAGPSTPRDTCCSCATEYSSLRLSMTVRCGRVANRFVLRMASATGPPRLRIPPSRRRASGVLAHGPSVVIPTSLRWHDRGGATIGPPTTARAYGSPRLSPDQMSVLVAITDATTAQPDVWLLAPARGTSSRVTSDPSSDWFPVWSHDGSGIFFGSPRIGSRQFFRRLASRQK